jgi:hypothetical protein
MITDDTLSKVLGLYLIKLVERLKDCLGDKLVGVYLFGSASYNAYEAGRSDLDVQAVVREVLSHEEKQSITKQLNHQSLPCPARKLEFVVYAARNINPASRHPHFELNFNTGQYEPDHISFYPAQESSHWFLLDIAIGRQTGRALYGPAPAEVFAPVARHWVLEAIADSLEWHKANELVSANSVLNACRSWRFIATNQFSSKLAGAEWALQQASCPSVARLAIEAHKTGENLPAVSVLELYNIVAKDNNAALANISTRLE